MEGVLLQPQRNTTEQVLVRLPSTPTTLQKDKKIHTLTAVSPANTNKNKKKSQKKLRMNSSILSFPKPITKAPTHTFSPTHNRHLHSKSLTPIRSSSSGSSNDTTSDGIGDASSSPPPITPSETVQIKFRRGARKRSRKYQEDGVADGFRKKAEVKVVKDWESMTMAEKAMELYVGEKGLLFWINKFAYASIYIIIGAWVVFRFVGPALNLYQLDAPPLSPQDVLKGS